MVRKDITYHTNPARAEENTPLVTILETSVEKKQSTAVDSRQSAYVIDLARSAISGIYYPIPGSQWYLKKIAGVWTLMSRAAQQNPQLDPGLTPVPGDSYIGVEGTTHVVGDLDVIGSLTVGGAVGDPELGMIKICPTAIPPSLWMVTDGSAISRTTYSDLYALIGTTYGVGDGSTTFNIPNIKGKVPVGKDSGQTEFDALGETGGEKTHTLLTAELPTHLHAVGTLVNGNNSADHTHNIAITSSGHSADHSHLVGRDIDGAASNTRWTVHTAGVSGAGGTSPTGGASNNHTHDVTGASGGVSAFHTHTITGSTANTGSDTAHNNLQPYIALNFIIKVLPSFAIPTPTVGPGLTEDGFHAMGSVVTDEGHTGRILGDTFKRFIIRDDGKTEWGSGSALTDTNLYRSAADTLKTDDALIVVGGLTAGSVTTGGAVVATGDVTGAKGRFGGTSGAAVYIGNDGVLVDVNLTDTIGIQGQANAANGVLVFGSGLDTNLYRSAADTLKTDDVFISSGGMYPIARTTVVGTSTASVSFTIPAAARAVHIKWSTRSLRAANDYDVMVLTINSVVTAVYNYDLFQNNNGSLAGASSAAQTSFFTGYVPAANTTAGIFGSGTVDIQSWDNPRPTGPLNLTANGQAWAANNKLMYSTGGYVATSGPWTTIQLLCQLGNFAAGSDIQVYGWFA